jgi:hypothetical protein
MGGVFFIFINIFTYHSPLTLFNIYADIRDFPEVFFTGFIFTLILIISVKMYLQKN